MVATSTSRPASAPSCSGRRRRATTRRRTSARAGACRRPTGPRCRSRVVRHRDTPLDGTAPALLYGYGAYEAVFDPSGTPRCPACSTAGWSTRTRTSAAAARAADAGGSTAGSSTSSTRSPTTSPSPTAWRRRASSTATRIATRGLSRRRAAPGRGVQPAPDRWRAVVAEVPFVDVVTTMLDAVDPADDQRVGRVG